MVKKILLIEDDKMFRSLVKVALTSDNYEIHEASDGDTAHDAIRSHNFDLIITDGNLSDIDGISLLREFRLNGIKTPVMFVSTLWRDEHSHTKLFDQLGVKVVLHKPVDPELVAVHADNLLNVH